MGSLSRILQMMPWVTHPSWEKVWIVTIFQEAQTNQWRRVFLQGPKFKLEKCTSINIDPTKSSKQSLMTFQKESKDLLRHLRVETSTSFSQGISLNMENFSPKTSFTKQCPTTHLLWAKILNLMLPELLKGKILRILHIEPNIKLLCFRLRSLWGQWWRVKEARRLGGPKTISCLRSLKRHLSARWSL